MTKKQPVAGTKKTASAKPGKDFSAVFNALQEILRHYEKHLKILPYKPEFHGLVTRLPVHKGKPFWFAAIRMRKNYVSYHFMPVYVNAWHAKANSARTEETHAGQSLLQL